MFGWGGRVGVGFIHFTVSVNRHIWEVGPPLPNPPIPPHLTANLTNSIAPQTVDLPLFVLICGYLCLFMS